MGPKPEAVKVDSRALTARSEECGTMTVLATRQDLVDSALSRTSSLFLLRRWEIPRRPRHEERSGLLTRPSSRGRAWPPGGFLAVVRAIECTGEASAKGDLAPICSETARLPWLSASPATTPCARRSMSQRFVTPCASPRRCGGESATSGTLRPRSPWGGRARPKFRTLDMET